MYDLTIDNYQQLAARTSATSGHSAEKHGCSKAIGKLTKPQTIRLLHGAMGLCTESGELMDQLKRHIFYDAPLDLINIAEECGDQFWDIAEILTAIDAKFLDVMQANIDKLRERYPDRLLIEIWK